jgi:heme-degrading monooxygenase HmoA
MTKRVITDFFSRLKPGVDIEYHDVAQRMNDLATQMPGYIEHKSFRADDGERVTIVTFADQSSHEAWRSHPEHRAAQQAGRERFYSEYSLTVAEVRHHREFPAG